MTRRLARPPAPAPLEAYATLFDPLFGTLAQRRGFRAYLEGLLAPRDRNKTLTALADAEPVVGAQHPAVQGLQFFLSESTWDPDRVTARRLDLLLGEPTTAPHGEGVLVVDDSGDRKAGRHTAHVARQYLGSVGKVDNGIVAVTTLWADERLYYPLHAEPFTPACRLPGGQRDPAFRTKPRIAAELVAAALAAGVPFRAVVADCGYGDTSFRDGLWEARLPYVLALKPSKGNWAPLEAAHTPREAAAEPDWGGPEAPGGWTPVVRHFRDGHAETWWAADARLAGYGPDRAERLVVATADPATLPDPTTWYLATNLPLPGTDRAAGSRHRPADSAEVVRLYGLRNWVEQGYRQVKQERGWADFQVRSDPAIRRHWALVCCAFAFCWLHGLDSPGAALATAPPEVAVTAPEAAPASAALAATGRGENGARTARRSGHPAVLAGGATPGARLAQPVARAVALLASVVHGPAAPRPAGAPGRPRPGLPAPLTTPLLTN